jgi:hypothetical protein
MPPTIKSLPRQDNQAKQEQRTEDNSSVDTEPAQQET